MSNRTRDDIHDYWRNPDPEHEPLTYIGKDTARRSQFLVDIVKRRVPLDAHILEIGCNIGRNLHYLERAGYENIFGIEISPRAVKAMYDTFTEAENWTVMIGSAERILPKISNQSFDMVFTMATLEHIHPESEWLFRYIRNVTRRYILTIEDEVTKTELTSRHFPRDYRKVFEGQRTRQIWWARVCSGLPHMFRARLFEVIER